MNSGYEKMLLDKQKRILDLKEILQKRFFDETNAILEVGCGHGRFLAEVARLYPERKCVGIDLINKRLKYCDEKKEKRALENLYFFKAEATEFVEAMPTKIFKDVFILFPDPWPKKRHFKKRLIQGKFLSNLASKLDHGARVFFRTDNTHYFQWSLDLFKQHSDWTVDLNYPWIADKTTYFEEVTQYNYQSFVAIRST